MLSAPHPVPALDISWLDDRHPQAPAIRVTNPRGPVLLGKMPAFMELLASLFGYSNLSWIFHTLNLNSHAVNQQGSLVASRTVNDSRDLLQAQQDSGPPIISLGISFSLSQQLFTFVSGSVGVSFFWHWIYSEGRKGKGQGET